MAVDQRETGSHQPTGKCLVHRRQPGFIRHLAALVATSPDLAGLPAKSTPSFIRGIFMTLPPKVQTAIDILAQYEISADVVAPFWYRQFLRFMPDTPPPLFKASRGYWTFRALKLALSIGIVLTLASLAIASFIAAPAERLLALTPQAQFAIWTVAGIAGWLAMVIVEDNYCQERQRLDLPSWSEFSANWRPAVDVIKKRADLQRFWLRGIRNAPMFNYGALAGSAAFMVFALLFPLKASPLAMTVAIAYMVICIIALQRTNRLRVMKPNPVVWQFSNGVWVGMLFAAVGWTFGWAKIVGYPADAAILVFFVTIIFLHILDARAYDAQKNLAIRIEHSEQAKRLAEIRLHTLKSQIEPHFIFNTLAHLKSMIATDPVLAERMADELSDFLRASLDALNNDWSTVRVEMALARAYLEIAKLRMGGRLSCQIDLGADVVDVKIPPLLVQTLLENAIQHGVEPKSTASEIHVSANLFQGDSTDDARSARLRIRVVDTGVGFAQSLGNGTGGTGIGLANIRERLFSTYGGDAQFLLTANTPNGVIAELILPIT